VIRITVSSPETSYIQYAWLPSPVYQYMIDLIVGIPIRRGPALLMNVTVGEHRVLND